MLMMRKKSSLHRGQWVRIRTEAEIASTLDTEGKLEGMPFMPEMARYCGQVVRIYRRARKTCVEGNSLRRLGGALLLEDLRCDGSHHDGCQRHCMYFWKEAWLEPVEAAASSPMPPPGPLSPWASQLPTRSGERYLCQSTELLGATRPLSRWNITHFFPEIQDGDLSFGQFLCILAWTVADRGRRLIGMNPLTVVCGTHLDSSRGDLNLQSGEWVRVKSESEIRQTLDSEGKNRGLSFESDMASHCGGTFQVDFPIQRIILEQTGNLIPIAHTVALKGVNCTGICTKNCPRNNTLYWREAWLERAEAPKAFPEP